MLERDQDVKNAGRELNAVRVSASPEKDICLP